MSTLAERLVVVSTPAAADVLVSALALLLSALAAGVESLGEIDAVEIPVSAELWFMECCDAWLVSRFMELLSVPRIRRCAPWCRICAVSRGVAAAPPMLVSRAVVSLCMRIAVSAFNRPVSAVIAPPALAVVSAGVTAAPAFPPVALGAGAAAVESATAPVSRARSLEQAAAPPNAKAPMSAARQRL